MLQNLNVRTVQRTDGQGAVQGEFHIARAGRFQTGGGNLLGQIRCRHDDLGGGDVVIRDEHDFEQIAHGRIVVDHIAHIVNQADDGFGLPIARCGLARKDFHARNPVFMRVGTDVIVQSDCFKNI